MQPLPPPETQPAEAKTKSSTSGPRQARDQTSTRYAPRPAPSPAQPPQDSNADPSAQPSSSTQPVKKRKHRGGKKRRNRQRLESFAAPASEASAAPDNRDMNNNSAQRNGDHEDEDTDTPLRPGESFYKKRNRSSESLESDALLDHRFQQPMRPRRESRLNVMAAQRAGASASFSARQRSFDDRHHRRRRTGEDARSSSDDDEDPTDRTPLMSGAHHQHRSPAPQSGHGLFRANTRASSRSSNGRKRTKSNVTGQSLPKYTDSPSYDVNNPPSVPTSPHLHASLEDPMMPPESSFRSHSSDGNRNPRSKTVNGDTLIDIDRQDILDGEPNSAPPSPRLNPEGMTRHGRSMTFGANDDVCMPTDVLSEMGEEDFDRDGSREAVHYSERRKRRKEWPQLWVLDEWYREEKEMRAAEGRRAAQRVQEPMLVDGRLRPSRLSVWHREEAPNRFTYFNIEFESTIHAPTIAELVPDDCTFRDLFIPEPPVIEDSSSSESEEEVPLEKPSARDGARTTGQLSPKDTKDDNGNALSRLSTVGDQSQRSQSQEASRISTLLSEHKDEGSQTTSRARSVNDSGEQTPLPSAMPRPQKEKRRHLGQRPQFWLDVLCPTPQEMSFMKSAFGIHPLTGEDILQQEAREKVELFKNYYFINYRTFEQDQGSEDYLEPVNVYILVFRHGILTFHFSQIPHPANVRRRIRQLQDYLELTADWISYAIIDDITDVFAPMITNIEEEVDEIDDAILQSTPGAFSADEKATGDHEMKEKEKKDGDDKSSLFSIPSIFKGGEANKKKDTSGYDMLRRVGETRKKVMSLYRLLGTKADVIKGFAKRCNEQWNVTPKNDIGLYLGDIQDHILTMTGNLGHYETLLSRAHSNYLAQVSIRMNERSEQTGDVLNKLTVFGTIVLPMNIICGMWGMNVKVPGQDIDNLWWFWGITAGLMAFAVGCYLLCKKLYGIV